MQVRDLMTAELCCASPDSTVAEVGAEIKRLNVGAIPICGADQLLLGIITDRDIAVECVAAGLSPANCRVREFMTAEPISIAADAPIDQVFRVMAHEQVHRLSVTEQGRLIGLLSAGDLAVNSDDDAAVARLSRELTMPVRSAVPRSQLAVR